MRNTNSFIGSPVPRTEDLRFLRGRGQFVADLDREGQWHGVVLRSTIAHGKIVSIDISAALAMPGINAVVTAKDIAHPLPTIPFRRPHPAIAPYAQPVIADEFVRYVGEPIAFVLADTEERAEDALQHIRVDIDPLPVVIDRQPSASEGALLFEGTGSNCALTFNARKGAVDEAFRVATYKRREQFRVQRMVAMPMETRGLLAEWDEAAKRLTMSGAAKLPFFNRNAMATMMGLPEKSVDYVEYDVGGGFGARGEFYPEDFLVAFAARKFGRPIKWVEDRREHFMSMAHARETECDIEMALDKDGVILGVRGDIYVDIGAYVRPNGTTPVRNVAQFLTGPYRVANIELDAHALVSNKVPSGTYRGPGRFEGSFFCERLLDIAASEMGIDPLAIRRRNLIRVEEMPYKLANLEPNDGFGVTQCDSGDYSNTFDQCLRESHWAEKFALQGQLIDGRYHGLGIGCFIEGGGSGPRENAKMTVERDGSISLYVGSSSVGQGIETIFAQIAADALEIPLDRIRVLHGSTTYLAEGFGSYGSRSTVMGGSAVMITAQNLLQNFRMAAAKAFDALPEKLVVADGVATAPDGRRATLAEFGLSAEGSFSNGSKATYTYGTAAAHVAVDPATGHVEVLDYVVVDDVGRVINPLTLHGQVVGAAVQGLGSVFSEEIVYDKNGQLLVGSLADYLIPVATDYPHVHGISLELYPSPNNPLGAKGAGEGGIIPVGGVLANAVAAALSSLGVRLRELPLTPPRLWELIRAAEA
ncbi:MAG TPA: xanthine dehydrogenase family protein molybdopterin-binding subunit [Micropepsaceae bacterium]|nr:xanthine dehydrogenase family protein molybdopterin-binding subunit [Micropepsaceae bacterium]